jgi:hypothetical protein
VPKILSGQLLGKIGRRRHQTHPFWVRFSLPQNAICLNPFLTNRVSDDIILTVAICWCGSMAEQLIRNEQVDGSIPFTSSKGRGYLIPAFLFFLKKLRIEISEKLRLKMPNLSG